MKRSVHMLWLLVAGMAVLAAGCSGPRGDTPAAHVGDSHEEATGHTEEGGTAAHAEEAPGHVEMPRDASEASGIVVQAAQARTIRRGLALPGEVVPNADRVAHIVPRFPGIVREVRKRLGDHVEEGEILAIVEGNQSLAPYEVRSLSAGTVIEKHATLGEFVRDDADIFVVADLGTVWVDVSVYARDVGRVQRGQPVRVNAVGSDVSATGTVDYVGSSVREETRAATAHVVLPNPGGRWTLGTFVTATIFIESLPVKVAVPDAALQTVEGRTCVFVEDGDGFTLRPVALGRTDGEWTEIASGLKAGERVATRGSFVLKSEVLKSEAGHGH